MTERVDAIVVGAGHNGLVCAAYLARAGIRVVCLESAGAAGGMSAPRTLSDQYHFPGLAQTAYPIGPALKRDLELDRFGYSPGVPVDTVALDVTGNHLVIAADGVAGDGLAESDRSAYPAFRKQYLEFAKALRPMFESRPPRLKNMDFPDKATLAKFGWKLRMGLGRDKMYEFLRVAAINIYDVLNDTFEDDRLKGALAADAVLGGAMGPRTPGTVLTWLQKLHGELNGPLSLLTGGASHLAGALVQSAESAGAEIRVNAHVDRIDVDNGRVTGVTLSDGETIRANIVVSNADPRSTFAGMVGAKQLDTLFANRATQIRGAGVVAKLNLALNALPDVNGLTESQTGNRLLVAPSMRYVEHAFNHAKYGEYSKHPVLDIAIPSVHEPALAPNGHHVMTVNVSYAPYRLQGGWPIAKDAFVSRITAQLGQYFPGLESRIVSHELLTPKDIEASFNTCEGHWHHGELSIHQSFMMRPLHGAAQYDTPVDGLFLCGAGCHPGGGLTGLPGQLSARRILEIEEAQ
jgi:phytoene dehydrogenase-like protein